MTASVERSVSADAPAPPRAPAAPRRGARWVVGLLLGWVARLWLATLRVRVVTDTALDAGDERGWVLCFFHGTQFPLLAWRRRRPTAALVSLSADGEMQAAALGVQGLSVVRGSSSRGGARGLAALVRRVRAGADAAFAVDGPRGPYGEAKPGAIALARATGSVLVPMGSSIGAGWIARRAWDRFSLPWPFTRVVVVLGAPLAAGADPSLLGAAIAAANERAERERCARS